MITLSFMGPVRQKTAKWEYDISNTVFDVVTKQVVLRSKLLNNVLLLFINVKWASLHCMQCFM